MKSKILLEILDVCASSHRAQSQAQGRRPRVKSSTESVKQSALAEDTIENRALLLRTTKELKQDELTPNTSQSDCW